MSWFLNRMKITIGRDKMNPDNLHNVLFIDTESDPVTKKPECLQWYFQGKSGIIEEFTNTTYEVVKTMWGQADSVVFFNAPLMTWEFFLLCTLRININGKLHSTVL